MRGRNCCRGGKGQLVVLTTLVRSRDIVQGILEKIVLLGSLMACILHLDLRVVYNTAVPGFRFSAAKHTAT